MHICIWLIATDIDCIRIIRTSKFCHHIFWKIDQYRSRSSCSCNIKGFFNNSSKILSVSYNNTVFRNTACNSYNINLLECIISDQWSCYLTCKTYERYTVIIRCCKTCNKVCSSRSACNKTDTYLTRCSGISIRLMNQCLLMSWQNDPNIILLVQFITDINRTCSRIAENGIHAFFLQRSYK